LYVANVSKAIYGSLTPWQIMWDLSAAEGARLEIAALVLDGVKLKRKR
jgi:hypothetical protein